VDRVTVLRGGLDEPLRNRVTAVESDDSRLVSPTLSRGGPLFGHSKIPRPSP